MIQPNGGGGVNRNVRDLFFLCGLPSLLSSFQAERRAAARRPGTRRRRDGGETPRSRQVRAIARRWVPGLPRLSPRSPGMTIAGGGRKQCLLAPDKHPPPDPERRPFAPRIRRRAPPPAHHPPAPAYNAARGGQRAATPQRSLTSPPSNSARPPRADADCQQIDAARTRARNPLNFFRRRPCLSAPHDAHDAHGVFPRERRPC